mmetsp:Transcript_24364/g.48502  ORF Transcript_24364/g.48502 Transcript_24364/m.48502 type:complete len:207 (-) Transcript_24364:260-880(-)
MVAQRSTAPFKLKVRPVLLQLHVSHRRCGLLSCRSVCTCAPRTLRGPSDLYLTAGLTKLYGSIHHGDVVGYSIREQGHGCTSRKQPLVRTFLSPQFVHGVHQSGMLRSDTIFERSLARRFERGKHIFQFGLGDRGFDAQYERVVLVWVADAHTTVQMEQDFLAQRGQRSIFLQILAQRVDLLGGQRIHHVGAIAADEGNGGGIVVQ